MHELGTKAGICQSGAARESSSCVRPEPARLAAAMKRFTLLLQVLGAGAVSDTVCDPAGLQQSPPVCQRASQSGTAHMPTVFGGPATLGQCVYGHFQDQQSNYPNLLANFH